jgi:hypothetical protein
MNLPMPRPIHKPDPRRNANHRKRSDPRDDKATHSQTQNRANHEVAERYSTHPPKQNAPGPIPGRHNQILFFFALFAPSRQYFSEDLRNPRLQQRDLLAKLPKLPIQHPLVALSPRVLNPPPNLTSFKFQPLNFLNDLRFRIVNSAHKTNLFAATILRTPSN